MRSLFLVLLVLCEIKLRKNGVISQTETTTATTEADGGGDSGTTVAPNDSKEDHDSHGGCAKARTQKEICAKYEFTEEDEEYLDELLDLDTMDLLQTAKKQLLRCPNYKNLHQIFYVLDRLFFRYRAQSFYKYILIEGSCDHYRGCKYKRGNRQGFFRGPDISLFIDDFEENPDLLDDEDEQRNAIRGYATDCGELRYLGETKSGIYTVYPEYSEYPLDVYCDMETDGGGWTVIQNRYDGSVDFYRGWNSYKYGFGELKGEHWLGLKHQHALTHQGTAQLRIDLEDADGICRHVTYDDFKITSEYDGYRLLIGMYSGNAGDSLSTHNHMQFSTPDVDHDLHVTLNCAQANVGGWWYRDCHQVNLNGLYLLGSNSYHQKGIVWYHFRGYDYSLKRTEMKIRRVKHSLHR